MPLPVSWSWRGLPKPELALDDNRFQVGDKTPFDKRRL
jgi:hypothetical protein